VTHANDKGKGDKDTDERADKGESAAKTETLAKSSRADDAVDEDEDEEEEEDEDDEEEDEHRPQSVAARAETRKRAEVRGAERRRDERALKSRARSASTTGADSPARKSLLFAVLGLLIGVGSGWFLGTARAKGRPPFSRAAPAGSGVSGECKTWQDKICAEAGDTSAGCTQAKTAAALMPQSACGVALDDVPATVAQLKKAREVCVNLVNKLCDDLGKDSQACIFVRSRTEQMPPERCRAMQENYASVLNQLQTMSQSGGMMGGPGSHPGGGMRPMMPGRMPGGPGGPPPGAGGPPPGSPGGPPPGSPGGPGQP
jgi:hypothetical protein